MNVLDSVWQYIVAGVALVVWFVRLEGKTDRNSDRIAEAIAHFEARLVAMELRHDQRRHEDNQSALLSRSELMDAVTAMQADIKSLLRGSAK